MKKIEGCGVVGTPDEIRSGTQTTRLLQRRYKGRETISDGINIALVTAILHARVPVPERYTSSARLRKLEHDWKIAPTRSDYEIIIKNVGIHLLLFLDRRL